MKFAAITLSAAAVAAFILPAAPPASAGPFGDNPLAWIAKHSTKGGEYNPPSGARYGLAPEVQGFGQRHFGVNSNDARRASIIVAPDPQHGEFQSVSLLFRDLVDEGAAHISVRGDDGRPLGRVDLARVGKSANGKLTKVEIPLTGAREGESIKLAVTVDDFLGKGGNGWTIIGADAHQNCEAGRPDIRFVRSGPIIPPQQDIASAPKPQTKADRREARQERREDRSERGGKGRRK
jgi:hypothetical protein